MFNRAAFCFAIVSLFWLTSQADAQTAATRTVPALKAIPARPAAPQAPGQKPAEGTATATPTTPATAPATPAADPETKIKAQRLTKLKALKFDRRPSAILKAWSEPPEEEAKDEGGNEEASNEEPGPDKGEETPAATPDPVVVAMQAFDLELKALQRNVTLGHWDAVGDFLSGLKDDERKVAYTQLLTSLRTPQRTGIPSQLVRFAEENEFSVDDVFSLIALAPVELDKPLLSNLSFILRTAIAAGNDLELFIAGFHEAVKATPPEGEEGLKPQHVARMLIGAGQAVRAGEFLPKPEEAIEQKDRDALNLLSQHFLALHQKEKKTEQLEQAWHVTQAALSAGEVTDEQKQEALSRAVDLAPKIREELGQTWLDESFTTRPERGMEILAAIGSAVSTGLVRRAMIPDQRARELELQHSAVNALIKAAPERATEWRETLDLLANNWLREANHSRSYDTSTSLGPVMQRDVYGNYFYSRSSTASRSGSTPRAIATGKLLEFRPDGMWSELLTASLQPRLATLQAQLYLKVKEDETAFPFIESLAETHPDIAKDLAEEFLRVWTSNHDPNSANRRTNIYMFSYGFNRRAQGIPLTRSKQDRNLDELSSWLKRLRALPIDELDEDLVTRAFTNTHGAAEVYRLEAIESVFGSLDELDPDTLAELIQKMRANLADVWREPATQEQSGTNRKKKDIEAEVKRGYQVARNVLSKAMDSRPEHWALKLAEAAIDHDENEYHQELEQSAKYSSRRDASLKEFREAAAQYAELVPELSQDEETVDVYDTWFYASLGACDINKLDAERVPRLSEPPLIREAILALPGEAAERHMAMFANSLFTRLSRVNPGVKYRFLRAGFEIVGDHKRAREARKVFDYYNDLVTEIQLEAVIDGNDDVGTTEPFGVFVNIRHTREIERESGGFSRYLQNQNNMYYSYNYGRPTENYRDKFEEGVRDALSEHFEVLSVTFQKEDVNSRSADEYGWRITPYAYLLLKPRGPEVDRIAPVHLDLDFLDTSGYAVIPIETAAVPISAQSEAGSARPIENLNITQTLDERQAGDGRLIVEIKATGLGLVPPLDQLLKVESPGFEVANVDDEGVSVSHFDRENSQKDVASERNWIVTLQAKEDLEELPKEFHFATALTEAETEFQRYVDADLASVEQVVPLEEKYGEARSPLPMVAAGAVALVLIVGLLVWKLNQPQTTVTRRRFNVPDSLTPFTVIGLLRDIESNNGFNAESKQELVTAINRLEQFYFLKENGQAVEEPELSRIASDWVNRAR